MGAKAKKGIIGEVFEWLEAVVFSLCLVVIIFTFIFRIVGVDGTSMFPTLNNKDRVVITNFFWKPKQNDIVVVTQPNSLNPKSKNEPLIKRIIAKEGQTVEFDFELGTVKVDGVLLDEPFINDGKTTLQGDLESKAQVVVEKGKVFVMGDNRNNSKDSRFSEIGQIDTRYLLGKAVFRLYPFDSVGTLG